MEEISSLRKPSTSERVRLPWAIVVPNGLSDLARSTSTWIHWSSPESSAKVSMSSWVTVRHSLGPISCPSSACIPSTPCTSTVAIGAQSMPIPRAPRAHASRTSKAGNASAPAPPSRARMRLT